MLNCPNVHFTVGKERMRGKCLLSQTQVQDEVKGLEEASWSQRKQEEPKSVVIPSKWCICQRESHVLM